MTLPQFHSTYGPPVPVCPLSDDFPVKRHRDVDHKFLLTIPVVAVAGLVGLVTLLGGATGPASQQASLSTLVNMAGCQPTGLLVSLDPTQSANAETIVSVTAAASGESTQAEQIALMVAITEVAQLPDLERGEGLWRLGERAFVVRHILTPTELACFDTNQRMIGDA